MQRFDVQYSPDDMDQDQPRDLRAPWTLDGRGYLLLHYQSRKRLLASGVIPPELQGSFLGGPGVVMLIDYESSKAGPYRELLYVPGLFSLGGRLQFSITRIYVSTEESVRGGRENWGIPKERADFHWDRRGEVDHVVVRSGNETLADLTVRGLGPCLPASTLMMPPRLRTIVQPWEGALLSTTLRAQGLIGMARLLEARIAAPGFPDLDRGGLLPLKVARFRMRFPPAKRTPARPR